MELVKPTKKTATDSALLIAGLVVGGFISKVGYGFLHDPNAGTTTDEKNKTKMMGYAKRGLLTLAGTGLAMTVKGDDTAAQLLKGAFAGLAVTQAIDATVEAAAGNSKIAAMVNGTKAQKALARGFGLGCPCNTPGMNIASLGRAASRHIQKYGVQKSGMNMPLIDASVSDGFYGQLAAA